MSKKGLGRGLQALLPGTEKQSDGVSSISLDSIVANPDQPRRKFDKEKLNELAESIKTHGVVQPIVVRTKNNKFEIVAGERRYRASLIAGLNSIPAVIKEYSDSQMSEIALIENIQREDLDPIEESNAYRLLIDEHKFTQETLAERIGKSRPFIANSLRLLNLPPQIQRYVSEGKLSVGHAKVLLSLDEQSLIFLVAEKIIHSGCSVRETEAIVKRMGQNEPETPIIVEKQESVNIDPEIPQIEDRLRSMLRTQVKIKHSGEKGKIEIEYYSKDELSQIVDTLLGELI
ncbi:MAG TPA: ParB/RepB/Spo0J family partition protein [Candidatus Deferrimicrobium sp.]|nr:ParB/RepB/Spo0J family partition protein [Candidatus Deferrimicrobium sp.]